MQAVLVMFRSDGERRSFSVTRDVTVIGRREDCDLRIPLGDISRKHSRLIKEGDQLRIEDLGSSNGTHLNGQRIERDAVLQAGDSIQVGPVVFVLQVDGYPADDELNPITAETAAAAAMFAAPGAEAPVEDPATDHGAYEQPAEYAEEHGHVEGSDLDHLEPLEEEALGEDPLGEDALHEDPLGEDALHEDPLARQPLSDDPLAEEPLALEDEAIELEDEPVELSDEADGAGVSPAQPPKMQPPPIMRPPPVQPPMDAPADDLEAVGDDELIPLEDPLDDPDGFEMVDDSGEAERPAEDELMIDFDEPEKK